jgi:hypothetical protein
VRRGVPNDHHRSISEMRYFRCAETTKSLAFDEACRDLHEQPDLVKEIIAKRIVEAAKRDERDSHRLCAKALDALGMNRRYS